MLAFLTLGILLELLHGLKIGWYLDVDNETRRLMFTLSHAHGTLLSLVNLAFASTLHILAAKPDEAWRSRASRALLGATVVLPMGFFLGGLVVWQGDPSFGVLLTPIGAALLFVAVLWTARAMPRG